ncbi:MAG: hypothetical protein AB8G77_07610 [Rhodothermales bacterium]
MRSFTIQPFAIQLALFGLLMLCASPLMAQSVPSNEIQIAGATSPAPADLKDDARILGYNADGDLVEIRSGTNDFTCVADNPFDERFHAACYKNTMDPFMSRGRELKKEGVGRDESREMRMKEIEAGKIKMPEDPAALYQLFGSASSLNVETGEVSDVRPLYVLYMPYATTETTGVSAQAPMEGAPWLMDAGLPWAHIMYSPASGN